MAYLTQSIIADDPYMRLRVSQCAAGHGCMDVGIDPDSWAFEWRREWAAAPQWDTKWESALAADPPVEDPGKDPGVITDGDINSQIEVMMPFTRLADHIPEMNNLRSAADD